MNLGPGDIFQEETKYEKGVEESTLYMSVVGYPN